MPPFERSHTSLSNGDDSLQGKQSSHKLGPIFPSQSGRPSKECKRRKACEGAARPLAWFISLDDRHVETQACVTCRVKDIAPNHDLAPGELPKSVVALVGKECRREGSGGPIVDVFTREDCEEVQRLWCDISNKENADAGTLTSEHERPAMTAKKHELAEHIRSNFDTRDMSPPPTRFSGRKRAAHEEETGLHDDLARNTRQTYVGDSGPRHHAIPQQGAALRTAEPYEGHYYVQESPTPSSGPENPVPSSSIPKHFDSRHMGLSTAKSDGEVLEGTTQYTEKIPQHLSGGDPFDVLISTAQALAAFRNTLISIDYDQLDDDANKDINGYISHIKPEVRDTLQSIHAFWDFDSATEQQRTIRNIESLQSNLEDLEVILREIKGEQLAQRLNKREKLSGLNRAVIKVHRVIEAVCRGF